ncbi:MAG: sulfatase [Spirochaetales bacterium]|nr:sulfatase [Spirochaetales bacterium]
MARFIKRKLSKQLGLLAFLFILINRPVFSRDTSDRPNIIVVLIDDMGWNDTGFMGNDFIDTPNMDRMAAGGVTFTTAYAAAPNCAPSRACLLTGMTPPRHDVYTVVDERHSPGKPWHKILSAESLAAMPGEQITIGEVLSDEGYDTALVGMWNLGKGKRGPTVPTSQGFDLFVEPSDLDFDKDQYHNDKGEYLTDRLTDSSIEFMEDHRNSPFFLYAAYHGIHAPFDPPEDLLRKYKKLSPGRNAPKDFAEYAASVESIDANMGRLWESLVRLGIEDNTYIFFTSDNGGIRQHTPPLRNGKGTLYEGGVRVPLFISGPGIEGGRETDTPATSLDFFPTIIALTGAPEHPNDGMNLEALLKENQPLDERPLFWHFPCYIGGGAPVSSVRLGDYKLMEFFETGTTKLYNLAEDPYEEKDLSQAEPEKARELYDTLLAWQEETGAPRPSEPNPAYDSSWEGKKIPELPDSKKKKR